MNDTYDALDTMTLEDDMNRDKAIEILRQWHEAGMIMPENLPDLADEILALVSEDELEPRVCDKCGAKWTDATDNEIASRMIKEYAREIDEHPRNIQSSGEILDWLNII